MKKVEKKKTQDAKPTVKVKAGDMPQSLAMSIDGQSIPALWKKQKDGTDGFSTGSKGWGALGKIVIAGHKCQVVCNIVIVGSKPQED